MGLNSTLSHRGNLRLQLYQRRIPVCRFAERRLKRQRRPLLADFLEVMQRRRLGWRRSLIRRLCRPNGHCGEDDEQNRRDYVSHVFSLFSMKPRDRRHARSRLARKGPPPPSGTLRLQ